MQLHKEIIQDPKKTTKIAPDIERKSIVNAKLFLLTSLGLYRFELRSESDHC